MYPSKNIIENAVNSKDHTTLVAAVKAAGLVETLQGPGPFTVFAPTNDAFGKLPAGTVDTLLKPENKAMLTKVLTYHVVAGRMTCRSHAPGPPSPRRNRRQGRRKASSHRTTPSPASGPPEQPITHGPDAARPGPTRPPNPQNPTAIPRRSDRRTRREAAKTGRICQDRKARSRGRATRVRPHRMAHTIEIWDAKGGMIGV